MLGYLVAFQPARRIAPSLRRAWESVRSRGSVDSRPLIANDGDIASRAVAGSAGAPGRRPRFRESKRHRYETTNVEDCGCLHGFIRGHPVEQPAGSGPGTAEENTRGGVCSRPRTQGRAGRVRPIRSGAELAEAVVGEPSQP